jgi:hypothetical protein
MDVEYEGNSYTFDLDEITVQQAMVIKAQCGLTLSTMQKAIGEGDPDGLRAMFWLMMVQSGRQADIARVDFKILKFAQAIREAGEQQEKTMADEARAAAAAERARKKANPTRR